MRDDIKECRSCGQEIVFLKTRKGSYMPVDVDDNLLDGDNQFEYGRHTSHFKTCPNAQDHRKPHCKDCDKYRRKLKELGVDPDGL